MGRNFHIGLWMGFLSILANPVMAHHGSRQHFHYGTEFELEGVITQFRWVNPHSTLYFEVIDETGESEQWRCEMPPASVLGRVGWTRQTLVPGQVVTIIGIPAQREERFCKANEFVLADQTRLSYDLTRGFAAEPASAAEVQSRPSHLPNGQPNISGSWSPALGDGTPPETRESFREAEGGPGNLLLGASLPEPTEAGALAAEGYDAIYDSPFLSCRSSNIIFDWVDEVNDIVQYDDRIVLKYGYMDLVRTIHLNEAEHPDNIEPSVGGHSIGWWEDSVLVVDTTGFEPGVLHVSGTMHSGEMHVTERFEAIEGGRRLRRSYMAEDPLYLQGPLVGEHVLELTADSAPDYNCVALEGKNNQRPSEQ